MNLLMPRLRFRAPGAPGARNRQRRARVSAQPDRRQLGERAAKFVDVLVDIGEEAEFHGDRRLDYALADFASQAAGGTGLVRKLTSFWLLM